MIIDVLLIILFNTENFIKMSDIGSERDETEVFYEKKEKIVIEKDKSRPSTTKVFVTQRGKVTR